MKSLIPVAIALAACVHAAADTVTLRSGTKVNGTVVRDDLEQVIIQDARGKFHTFARADVSKVETNDLGKKKPETKPAETEESDSQGGGATPAIPEVLAIGVGKDAEAARGDALRQAVSQVVGSLVVASDAVANDQLINSKILTYSDGYVEKWEPVGEPSTEGGMVRVKIRAWVRRGKLTKALAANNVPVRDIDLRSMQGQSETTARQARSAAEVVAALFTGFPAKLLVAEPLNPIRISGDEGGTVVEVPVRVKVDVQRWKTFVAEAKRVLGPIAEANGIEVWNTQMTGWYSLSDATRPTPAMPKVTAKQGKRAEEPNEVKEARSGYWLTRFVPVPDRPSGSVGVGPYDLRPSLPPTKIGAERKRVIAILDSMGGKLHWWQLPQDAWASLLASKWSMHMRVDITDRGGKSIAIAIEEWTETLETNRPGEKPKMVAGGTGSGLGGKVLVVGHRTGNEFWSLRCAFRVKPDGILASFSEGDEFLCMLIPAALGWDIEWRRANVLAPSVVFPYRFRIPGEIANLAADSKVVVEFVDP